MHTDTRRFLEENVVENTLDYIFLGQFKLVCYSSQKNDKEIWFNRCFVDYSSLLHLWIINWFQIKSLLSAALPLRFHPILSKDPKELGQVWMVFVYLIIIAMHTVLMDPIEHFMLGNSPFMRYPYTQYMRPSGTVLGTPE